MQVIKLARKYFRNTPVHRWSITTKIYQATFALATGKKSELTAQIEDLKFIIPAYDITLAPSMLNGDYEKFELEIARTLIHPDMVIYDVGANIGIYSIFMASLAPNGTTYAFEPIPDNINYLKRNITLNKMKNIRFIQSAIGNQPGKLTIYLQKGSIGTHSAVVQSKDSIEVEVTTIDKVAQEFGSPDLIKMDIEGFEGAALSGATKTLSKQPILLMEFSRSHLEHSGYSPSKVMEILLKNYRHCFHIDEKAKRLRPITNKNDAEALQNTNILCLPQHYSQKKLRDFM